MIFSNSQSGVNFRARADLMRVFAAAVAAVEPRRAVSAAFESHLQAAHHLHDMLEKARRVYLLAAGKAAMGMAIEGRERIGPKLCDALVIVPVSLRGAGDPSLNLSGVQVLAAAHP